MKPDVIVTWPKNCDYPLWREYVHLNREKFNNVIVSFMEPNQMPDYADFIKQAMFPDFVQFIEPRPLREFEDWRNASVNQGLFQSLHAEWIFFTEQDFYPKAGFWEFVYANEDKDVITVSDNGRLHPCGMFVRRSFLDKTRKDFGILEGRLDHFGKLQEDTQNLGAKVAIIPEETYYHYNGLSQNFNLMVHGFDPNYKKLEFDQYLYKCLDVLVPLEPNFVCLVRGYLEFQRL
jgi:hypothetical protein